MNQEALTEILRLHQLWLDGDSTGVRADLTCANLRFAKLSGADLTDADLTGADLSCARLIGARLTGADLSCARLIGARLTGANLKGADLSCAYLTDAKLSCARLIGAKLTDAYLINAKLSGANLTGANLKGANLFGAKLSGAYLKGAKLSGAYLSWANLKGANLSGADLTGANIPKVKNLHTAILAAIESGGTLDMNAWHTCETTHCRAGWAVHLAGEEGRLLEDSISTNAAAALIITRSCPYLDGIVPDFYATNDDALADIKRCAQIETTTAN